MNSQIGGRDGIKFLIDRDIPVVPAAIMTSEKKPQRNEHSGKLVDSGLHPPSVLAECYRLAREEGLGDTAAAMASVAVTHVPAGYRTDAGFFRFCREFGRYGRGGIPPDVAAEMIERRCNRQYGRL